MYLFVCVYWGGGGKGKTFYNVKQLEMQNIRPFKALEDTSLCFRDRDSVHIFQCQVGLPPCRIQSGQLKAPYSRF